jgi:hypothetical protein
MLLGTIEISKKSAALVIALSLLVSACRSHTPVEISTTGVASAPEGPRGVQPGGMNFIPSKIFTWGELRAGDCHQIEGKLELRMDGTAAFTSVTWTDSTSSGDYWWSGMLLQDSSGVTLHNEPYHRGPRMDDGNPSPRYHFNYNFTFDKTQFPAIVKVVQSSKC